MNVPANTGWKSILNREWNENLRLLSLSLSLEVASEVSVRELLRNLVNPE